MTKQFIPDDTEALREWARSVSSMASSARARVQDLNGIASMASVAGQGVSIDALRKSLSKLQDRLTKASDHLSQGARVLTTLADTLDRLEEDAERKFRHYGSPKRFTPEWLLYEAAGEPWVETSAAQRARHAAGSKLRQLAEAAPGAEHHESTWQRFLDHVKNGAVDVYKGGIDEVEDIYHVGKDVATDLAGEVVGIGKTVWTLKKLEYELGPENFILNHKQWQTSWSNAIRTGQFVMTHKKEVGGAIWDGVIDKDMWRKDKAAWAIVFAVNLLGPKGLGKAAGALRGAEGVSEGARGLKGVTSLTKVREIRRFSTRASLDQWEGTARHQGHTYARHTLQDGKTSQQLMEEQFQDPELNKNWDRPAGGIFYSKEVANHILQKALHDQARKVAKFMRNPEKKSETLFVVSKEPVGTAMARTDSAERVTLKTRIYLVKDPVHYAEGFYVKSMFPEL